MNPAFGGTVALLGTILALSTADAVLHRGQPDAPGAHIEAIHNYALTAREVQIDLLRATRRSRPFQSRWAHDALLSDRFRASIRRVRRAGLGRALTANLANSRLLALHPN